MQGVCRDRGVSQQGGRVWQPGGWVESPRRVRTSVRGLAEVEIEAFTRDAVQVVGWRKRFWMSPRSSSPWATAAIA